MPPQPAPSTRALVHRVVVTWRNLVKELVTSTGFEFTRLHGGVLRKAVWISQGHLTMTAPYDKYPVESLLEELLASDLHLRATCLDAATLARALEVIFLDHIIDDPVVVGDKPDLDEIITNYLIDELFLKDYTRTLYFRVYNLFTDRPAFPVLPLNAILNFVADLDIPGITGEPTPTSTLHLPETGNTFLVFEDTGFGNDSEWWSDRWTNANTVVGVLKYLKYGIVDVDYSVMHFTPNWVNRVRKYGISMWGRPRTDVQEARFMLDEAEHATVVRYLNAALRYRSALQDLRTSLRRAMATAGDYFEGHHKRTTPEDQLIDLVIALESLFSPSDKGELRFRISLNAALLLGKDPEDRSAIMDFVMDMYDHRSALVHGGRSPFEAGGLTTVDLARLGDLVREAILRFGVLYIRGQHDRQQVLNEIKQCAFNPAHLEDIRRRSEFEIFLAENGL